MSWKVIQRAPLQGLKRFRTNSTFCSNEISGGLKEKLLLEQLKEPNSLFLKPFVEIEYFFVRSHLKARNARRNRIPFGVNLSISNRIPFDIRALILLRFL
ncbi:hypothetical protein CDAR_567961 [Caerostris darwini]|uniref:Uncharacterized protein n=1 Tax=Caerostris darwini TaxID=1538125 RepID=A0AAV4SL46_9ARAC|nr:hypothetical protein CDAR_567961 [Caerostris darwini]